MFSGSSVSREQRFQRRLCLACRWEGHSSFEGQRVYSKKRPQCGELCSGTWQPLASQSFSV